MRHTLDIAGRTFGELRAVRLLPEKAVWGGPLWEFVCSCGTVVRASLYNVVNGNTRSCGHLRLGAKSRDLSGRVFGWWTVLTREVDPRGTQGYRWICQCRCGKEQLISGARLESKVTTCCRNCRWKKKRAPHGRAHHCYNPRLTSEDRRRRDVQEGWRWAHARRQTFARDDFTCVYCGARGGELRAHHVYPWKDYRALRYKVENLVTLCQACHAEFHAACGLHGLEPEDTIWWLTK